MKVQYCSDLHTEFDKPNKIFYPEYVNEDVLVIAGDALVFFNKHSKFRKDFIVNYFLKLLEHRNVVYVFGNHEFYKGDISHVDVKLLETEINQHASSEGFKHKIYILDGKKVSIDGVTFVGGILWTDFRNRHPMIMLDAQMIMNDYKNIKLKGVNLIPNDTADIFDKHISVIKECLYNKSEKTVVVTHHAPSRNSCSEKYKNSTESYCYYSDLDEVASMADVWIHGHMHNTSDYYIGDCRVLCNPRGYHGYAINKEFSTKTFEI